MKRLLTVLLLLNIWSIVSVAQAVKHEDPLKGQPAVRKRILYLPNRFEVTPSLGVSFLQDYKHSILIGAKAEYHFNDYLSVGFSAHFSPFSLDTALTDEIQNALPDQLENDTWVNPTPSKKAMMDALNEIKIVMGPHVAYTPAFGKMGLFGSLFFDFDVYFYGGVGFVYLQAGDLSKYVDEPTDNAGEGLPGKLHLKVLEDNGGWRVGPQAGMGFHVFINRWIAFNTEFRWLYIKRNAAGFDRNGDTYEDTNWLVIDSKDEAWENTMFFHFGASLFFPQFAPRSE